MTKTKDELLLLKAHNSVPEKHDPEWANSYEGRAVFTQIEDRMARVQPARKRPRWRRPTVTIPVFVVLSGTALLFASAIAGDKVVTVSAQEALNDPRAVERHLGSEGIDADIKVVPVKDDLVGKWFHLYLEPSGDINAETFALLKSYVGEIDYRHEAVAKRCGPTAAECERTAILELPGSVKGPITLVVGRAAEPGEEYWARNIDWGNELAPSGALYCFALEEETPHKAQETLQAAGYEVIFNYETKESSAEVATIPAGTAITSASLRDTRTAVLNLAPEQSRPGYPGAKAQRLSMGTPTEESGRPDFGSC